MNISKAGLDLIKEFEGLRLSAYQDSVGVWTIGYGHTRTAKQGMSITGDQADALLIADLSDAEDDVERYVRQDMRQNEFDALVSLIFNIGGSNFSRSTMLRLINEKAEAWKIGAEFLKWVYAKGRKLPGLERRRLAERNLYLKGENA
ncbi:TPA: lysozyme [Pseudomonas aeruginosa]